MDYRLETGFVCPSCELLSSNYKYAFNYPLFLGKQMLHSHSD